MAEGTVTLPAVGPVKREHLVVGGAAAGVGVAVLVWRHRAAAGAAEAAAAVEPDAAAGDYAAGVDAYQNPGGSTVTGSSAGEIDPESLPPSSNPAWTLRAVARLSEVGWDPMTVTSALSRYLAHQEQADTTGVEVVRTALAMVGPPPNGEFSILMPTTPTAPTPAPAPAAPTAPAAAPAGLKASSVSKNGVHLSYHSVPGASAYRITRSPGGPTDTSAISYDVRGLKSNTKYSFTVAAIGPGGVIGPTSSAVAITTKK